MRRVTNKPFMLSVAIIIVNLLNEVGSSSSVVSPSALHSYVKRRFISPFAPPCYPRLSLAFFGGGGGRGSRRGEVRGVRRKLSGAVGKVF